MEKLWKFAKIIDNYLLHFLLVFFIFFIPLYPKIPLVNVNYTYIAIRLEDIYIAFLYIVFFIEVLRKKITINKKFLILFCFFWIAVLASWLSGIYITKTIEFYKVGFFHAIRRIEYMMIFLVVVSSLKSLQEQKNLFYSFLLSFFLVAVYGFGQRIANFPSISTMNPEFAKGRVLFLEPEARLASTFAGHYDLAAFCVFIIPILLGFILSFQKNITFVDTIKSSRLFKFLFQDLPKIISKNKAKLQKEKIYPEFDFVVNKGFLYPTIAIAFATSFILSNSFVVFIPIILIVLVWAILFFIFFPKISPRVMTIILFFCALLCLVQTASRSSFIAYAISASLMLLVLKKFRMTTVLIIVSIVLFIANKNLSQRFFETFQVRQFLVNELTGEIYVLQKIKKDKLPAGTKLMVKIPEKKARKSSSEEIEVKKDLLRKIEYKLNKKESKKLKEATISAYQTVSGIAPDISFTTRLQVEWPRAINAFKKNPLLGSGPSSITESTDNDFLRWLGEFGILGFLLFIAILYKVVKTIYERMKSVGNSSFFLYLGCIFGIFGLLINALYIDVFEASKVAYVFWFISGLFAADLTHLKK